MDIGDRVKRVREDRGWTQEDLARRVREAGAQNVKQAHIGQLERGETRQPRYLVPLAKVLGVTPDWLHSGDGEPPAARGADQAADLQTNVSGYGKAPALSGWPRDLPVYGSAVGSAEDWGHEVGAFELNLGEPIDRVRRPPRLDGARDAFAVFAVGESMMPRFRPGAPVIIHPGIQPANGDDVLVELHPKAEGGPHPALLKRLVSRTATQLRLQQFNPPDDKIMVPLKRVIRVYRVVPYEELFGF